jgi:hypothetical protein
MGGVPGERGLGSGWGVSRTGARKTIVFGHVEGTGETPETRNFQMRLNGDRSPKLPRSDEKGRALKGNCATIRLLEFLRGSYAAS